MGRDVLVFAIQKGKLNLLSRASRITQVPEAMRAGLEVIYCPR